MAAIESNPTIPEDADNLKDRLRNALARLNNQQKILLMVSFAVIVALLVASNTWFKQSDYRVLFSNISERDGGAIIASLEQLNVPYKFSESGGAILIPGVRVHEVRLRLATQGLPKGGGVGFELMENQKFGISQFAEQVNYQRGLEGELSRTIQSIGSVQAARVHLAIPKPTVFVREELKPSASVMLNLYPGRSLEASQIAGIQNLVAASVPSLAVSSVTLIDQSGAMLSQLKSKLMEAGLDPTQIKYVQEIEANAIKRIEDILLPIVGNGNARVQVAADVDFSQNEQTAETHRPNTTPPDIAIRSQQTSESGTVTPNAQGVPGALSNQPPVPATAPIVEPPGLGSGQNGSGQPINTRKDSTINYEVDKTIRHTKQSIGTINRLSAAVVINHRKDARGLLKPLEETEIKQINVLVKEALGFKKERGDTVSVANAPFSTIDRNEIVIPMWRDPEVLSLLKEFFKYAALAAIVLYLIIKVIRPLIKTMTEVPPEEQPETLGENVDIVDDEETITPPTAAESFEEKLAQARAIAQQDPKVVVNIIRDWTANGGEEGIEKSAILLISLGEDFASQVLMHLTPKEVQKLGHAMAALKTVPRARVEEVLAEFQRTVNESAAVHVDTDAYVRSVLTKALGDDKAANLISRILQGGETNGIEGLKWMDAPTVADLIRNEHPQIIATILVHLENDHASAILNQFTDRLRNDVVLRIATLEGIQPDALRELNDVMLRLLSGSANIKKAAMGGVRSVAEILNFMGSANEATVIESIREYDPDLAQRVLDEMFVFENLLDLDDRAIQSLLREIQSDSLILAMKGASENLREKIFKNMSQRAAEMLREDLESRGPVRLSEVEAEQKEILKIVRRLADEGQIVLSGAGGEEMI